jgi:hypothetical protein
MVHGPPAQPSEMAQALASALVDIWVVVELRFVAGAPVWMMILSVGSG